MKNEDRIVELLAELVQKQDVFADKLDSVVSEVREMKTEMREMKTEMREMKTEIRDLREDMNGHTAKTNAGLNEVRLSVMRLVDKLDKQDEIEKRVSALEKIVSK